MDPRLDNSQQWTRLPHELVEQIKGVFAENFGDKLKAYKFIFEGRIYKNELLLRAGLLEDGRIKQYNFEVSIEFDPKKENALKIIHTGIDALGALLNEYLNGVDFDEFPKFWQKDTVGKKDIYFQTSGTNTDLEAQADALLGEDSDGLVGGEDEEEIRKQVIHMLGLGEDEEDGKNKK